MLRTLHSFLAKELAKVGLLALVAFTVVMTVFAIVEPLRKRGLGAEQVLLLFSYTVPVMLSLTLPIAALFAATIVYGRFSQDNELLACRAGGIATLSLLKPALVLGLLVTAASLWLGDSVAPRLVQLGEVAVKGSIRGIAYSELASDGYIKYGPYLLHADGVDREHNTLHGVVLADCTDPNNIVFVIAERTGVVFSESAGDPYVAIQMEGPVVTQTGQFSIFRERYAPVDAVPVPNPLKESPSWYSWAKLVDLMEHPAKSANIQRSLVELQRDLGHEMLAAEAASAINSHRLYAGLRNAWGPCEISAARAVQRALTVDLESEAGADGNRIPVRVRVRGPGEVRTIEGLRGKLQVAWSPLKNMSLASVTLEGDVRVRVEDVPAAATGPATAPGATTTPATASRPAPAKWVPKEVASAGQLEMPKDLADSIGRMDANLLLASAKDFTSNPALVTRVETIANRDIASLRAKILAEMHGRLAYGGSCFLMVAMGAALGLLYRGGQIISAFALAMAPAAVVIIMIIMGKELLCQIKVPPYWGLSAIWGGIVVLAIGNLALYIRLARR